MTTITNECKVCIFFAAKETVNSTQLPRFFGTSNLNKIEKKTVKDEFNAKNVLEKMSSYSEQQGFYQVRHIHDFRFNYHAINHEKTQL